MLARIKSGRISNYIKLFKYYTFPEMLFSKPRIRNRSHKNVILNFAQKHSVCRKWIVYRFNSGLIIQS